MQGSVIARLERVHKRYGAVAALDGVDIQLKAGEVLALLGANGAGKTTAVSLMLGLVAPDEGSVELMGRAPQSRAARCSIGAMLQASGVPETLRVGELLSLFAGYYPEPHPVRDVAALADIEPLLGRLYGKLSGGQQRRVQFALALVGRPRALFLDEPTVGLDVEARQAFWSVIRARVRAGCAVLRTTHYLEEAEALADRVVVLANGRVIAEGRVETLRANTLQRLVRCRCAIPPDRLVDWPDIDDVAYGDDGRLQLKVADAERVLRRLFAEDAGLTDLEVGRVGLADTFMELTREAA